MRSLRRLELEFACFLTAALTLAVNKEPALRLSAVCSFASKDCFLTAAFALAVEDVSALLFGSADEDPAVANPAGGPLHFIQGHPPSFASSSRHLSHSQ